MGETEWNLGMGEIEKNLLMFDLNKRININLWFKKLHTHIYILTCALKTLKSSNIAGAVSIPFPLKDTKVPEGNHRSGASKVLDEPGTYCQKLRKCSKNVGGQGDSLKGVCWTNLGQFEHQK